LPGCIAGHYCDPSAKYFAPKDRFPAYIVRLQKE